MKKIMTILFTFSLLMNFVGAEEMKKIKLEEDSVDIQEKKFDVDVFWEILPWKDNTSITIDGWGKYSVLSFDKKGKLKQKTLCDYPKKQYDRIFFADDKTGFIYASANMMYFLYNADTKIQNSLIPVLSWKGYTNLYPLNKKEILVQFVSDKKKYGYFIYEHSAEEYERQEITDIRDLRLLEQFYDDKYKFLAKENDEYFIYDWKNQKKETNKLTQFFNENKIKSFNFNMKNNRAFVSNSENKYMIFWNEDFSEFKIYNLKDYLSSDSYSINIYSYSGDGKYAFASIYAYDEQYQCGLYHLTFIDMDKFKEDKNPIKPTDLITDRTDSFFTTGFVFDKRNGWNFIFTDETAKAFAISMNDLF